MKRGITSYTLASLTSFLAIVFLVAFLCFATPSAHAQCNQAEGIGEVFYNFDKLYVLYAEFPHPDDQKLPYFPAPLKFENFNNHLLATVRQNFGSCLRLNPVMEKPIIVSPPSMMLPLDREAGKARQEVMKQMHDPHNLTLLIRVSYSAYPPRPPGTEDFGQAFFYFYRPDVAYKEARLPRANNSGMITFFPKKGEKELEVWLDGFFRQIKPAYTSYPTEEQLRHPE